MRLKLTAWMLAGALLGAPAAAQEPPTAVEPPPELPPSAQKSQRILQKTIEALGGEDFLQVGSITRRGRYYQFERGQLAGPGTKFVDYVKFPGKERLELGDDGKIVYVNNQDEGWELDKQGVRDMAPGAIENFVESMKHDPDYLLRFHVPEDRVSLYYQGREFVDNRRAHLVEVVHEDNTSVTLVIDAHRYLPMQVRYRERDAVTGDWVQVVDFYGKYITQQGVQTWMQLTRERNRRRSFEVHVKEVEYNRGVPDRLFTRASLEERWQEIK